MSLENFPNFLLNFSECEMNGEEKHFYQFKSFRLDVEERQLLKNNSPVALTPKAFDVLAALVTRCGHLVEKEELLRLVWADSFVEEANIPRIVHTLRKTLGEDENGNKLIETVAKKGYRFVAKVTEVREPSLPKSENGNGISAAVAEKLIETGDEIPTSPIDKIEAPSKTDKIDISPVIKKKYRKQFVLLAVGFISAILLISLLAFNWRSDPALDPNAVKSIAVLPLNSLTAENRDPLYELGIADSLILALSQVKNLTVRPLSATQSYADGKKDAVTAGREQKVDYVLASNYQIADGKIRITSQLINVSTGAIEEIFKNEQNIADGFTVQDAVAANVGRKLLTRLNREPNNLAAKLYTTSEEAYRHYLIGTVLVDKRNAKDAEKAVEYFENAVQLDPHYALAYARLANAHCAAYLYGAKRRERYLKAQAAIEKALSIDNNLAEAHTFAGEIKFIYEWDFAGAGLEFQRAIELNPNSAATHQLYAVYLISMGRFDEAIAESKTALDLEPASALNLRTYAQTLYNARRYDEAIAQLKQIIEIDPNFRTAYGWLINSYRMKGEEDQAFEWFLRAPHRKEETSERIELWKTLYAQTGWRGIYQRQIEDAKQDEKEGKTPYLEMARLYGDLGDKEQAITYLQKGFEVNQRGWRWTTLKVDQKFDLIRDDPRFQEIVGRVGLK